MAENVRRAVRRIEREMRKNLPIVKRKLVRSRARRSSALVSLVAYHYEALDRLAGE